MNPRRALFVCSSTGWAGTEKWTLRAAEELVRLGWEVTFVARAPELFSRRASTAIRFEHLPLRNEADMASILRLSALMRQRARVTILTRVRDYGLGGIAARMAGVPALLRLGVQRRLRDRYVMDRLRYGMLPSAILVNALAIRDTLAETPWIDPRRVHVIYNGVETPGPLDEVERAQVRHEAGVGDDDIFIVGAGRLAVEKRWNLLIDSAARLVEDDLPVQLRILGEGGEQEFLETLVRRHGVSDRVRLAGFRSDAARWLAAADIVALPSDNEGISNTMLEAMGRAVPVVATASGGVREHFEDGRDLLLADTHDLEGFHERLALAASDGELRRRIGRQGFETVRESFRWARMGEELERLLLDMIEGTA